MTYFKIIKDNVIIGAITSNDFMRYLPITDCFVRADELTGEYATYKGTFYRATWMLPIVQSVKHIDAQLIEITEEEYNAFVEALEVNETITIVDDERPIMEELEEYIDPLELMSLEYIRSSKLIEMSRACRTTIENGFDLSLRGEIRHFSLDTQDQLNLISLSAMALTQELIPYHADGEECIFYTAEEMNLIVATATQFKIYHTTYYNALKTYINALDTIEDISAITYGTPIPEEYQSDVLKAIV